MESRVTEAEANDAIAAKIISDALNDRAVYDAMAEREAEVWGKVLPAREANIEAANDRQAANALRLNREMLKLPVWLHQNKRHFSRGLSIGCGEGRFERWLFELRVCDSFVGLDVSESALEVARTQAKALGFDATYKCVDLNFIDLEEESFDFIGAQTTLHHVLRLEHVAEQLFRALRPGGILWIDDYIGESQFQHTDARMKVCNSVIANLPDRYRFDRVFNRQLKRIVRRRPGTLISPFESIRSAEIAPIFLSRFEVVEKRETTSILHLVAPVGTRAAFAETEDSRTLFETLLVLDSLLLKHGILGPTNGQYILTKPALSTT